MPSLKYNSTELYLTGTQVVTNKTLKVGGASGNEGGQIDFETAPNSGRGDYSIDVYSTGAGGQQFRFLQQSTAGANVVLTIPQPSASGDVLTSVTPIGYVNGVGVGGVVTQDTSKSTDVTLNKLSGVIVTNNSSLSPGEIVEFGVINSYIQYGDIVLVSVLAGTGYFGQDYTVTSTTWNGTGNFFIELKNISGSLRSDNVVIKFIIIKGANS